MKTPIAPSTLSQLQWIGVVCAAAMAAAVLWTAIRVSEDVAWLQPAAEAQWITPPQRHRTKAIPIRRDAPPALTFLCEFRLGAPPARAVVHVRALKTLALSVNGQVVALDGRVSARWKRQTRVDIAALLRPGANRIEAVVANPEGPPALQLWVDGLDPQLATGSRWRVARGKAQSRAVIARDVRSHPQAEQLPVPGRALLERWSVLLPVFLLGAAGAWLARPLRSVLPPERWPRMAWLGVAAAWLWLYAGVAVRLPRGTGFDAEAHADYVRLLAAEARLPLATDGWAMFHPPLFHASAAALRTVFGAAEGSALDRALLHAIPILSGLAIVFAAARIARRLFPARPGVEALSVLAAGLMPMNLYIAVFVSNESLHAAWVSLFIWMACELLVAERASKARLAALSVLMGLALLTKYTALVALPVVALFVLVKLWLVEGRSASRSLWAVGGVALGVAGIAGWFYARNWIRLGHPFVTNYDAKPGFTYWMAPGFRTADWYLGFGEALIHPFFASFSSFWDGLYATFWGDAYASGRAGVEYPNPVWSTDWMAAGYLLALPATALVAIGLAVFARRAIAGRDLGRRLAFSLVLVLGAAFFSSLLMVTLRYPHYWHPKAFYALGMAAPVAVCFAAGAARVTAWLGAPVGPASVGRGRGGLDARTSGSTLARALLYGWGAALAFAIVRSFLA